MRSTSPTSRWSRHPSQGVRISPRRILLLSPECGAHVFRQICRYRQRPVRYFDPSRTQEPAGLDLGVARRGMCESEVSMLRKAVAGDQDSLGKLLKDHLDSIRIAIAQQIPKRWQSVLSAEDVVQETFADAIHDIGRFNPDGDGSFCGWLRRIADYNLRDALRMLEAEKRGGARRRVEVERGPDSKITLLDLLTSSGSTPSHHAAGTEATALLEKAIRKLPRDYRHGYRIVRSREGGYRSDRKSSRSKPRRCVHAARPSP